MLTNVDGMFNYKASMLGIPDFWKPSFIIIYIDRSYLAVNPTTAPPRVAARQTPCAADDVPTKFHAPEVERGSTEGNKKKIMENQHSENHVYSFGEFLRRPIQ